MVQEIIRRLILETYREGKKSTVTHNKKTYSIDKMLDIVENQKIIKFDVDKLIWIFKDETINVERLIKKEVKYPIIITYDKDRWVILDGLHRLVKTYVLGNKTIDVKKISKLDLEKCKI